MSSSSPMQPAGATGSRDDHEAVWGDNTEMLEKTKAYQERAKKAIENDIISPWIPNPWTIDNGDDQPDIPWRLCVIEFAADDAPSAHHFGSPRELLKHWQSASSDARTARRRVVILEDMDARMVELLGVLLDIPPEFFLAHCSTGLELSVVDRFYSKKRSSHYWKVEMPRIASIPAGVYDSLAQYPLYSGSFWRYAMTIRTTANPLDFESPVSYWGSNTHDDGSWTAVVLVDSHLCWVRQPATKEVVHLETLKQKLYRFHETVIGLPNDKALQPHERSLFNAIVDAYICLPAAAATDPSIATTLVRNVIRSTWEDSILNQASDTYSHIVADETLQHQGLTASQMSDRFILAYQNWGITRRTVRNRINMLRVIVQTFCHQDRARTEPPDVTEDRHEWRRLEQRLEDLDSEISSHMKTYAQLSIMRESFEGHRQTVTSARLAKSSGRLLNLATIFVPFTLVASVFSMNGRYAAGESRFFVFWVVSIPCALALVVWVMYTDFWVTVWKRFRSEVSRRWLNLTRRQVPDEEKAE